MMLGFESVKRERRKLALTGGLRRNKVRQPLLRQFPHLSNP